MSLYSTIVVLVLVSRELASPVTSCRVSSYAAAVEIGNNVSVTCLPGNNEYITRWTHYNMAVYQPQNQRYDKFVANGYSVNDSSPSQVTLTLISATVDHAGNYACYCQIIGSADNPYSSTDISIIDSEPRFLAAQSVKVVEPFNVTCSLSVAGIINSNIQILNSSGNVLSTSSKSISSNISLVHSLDYTVPQFSRTVYYCNISLSDSRNESAILYTKRLNITLQFEPHNASIVSGNSQECENGGFCKQNIKLLCQLEGLSATKYYQWIIHFDRAVSLLNVTSDSYITESVGQQAIQCTAFGRNNDTFLFGSANFTTNVTTQIFKEPSTTTGPDKIPLIVGLVVGLGGGIILIIIIIICIVCLCKRKKRRTACCEPEQQKEGKEEVQIEANTYEGLKGKDKATKGSAYGTIKKKQKEKPKGPPATKANGKTKGVKKIDETTLVDNNLYSKNDNDENNVDSVYNTSIHGEDNSGMQVYNTSIHGVDPSDGGYADLDEFGAKGKF